MQMLFNIEDILLLFQDMQDMVNPDDDLSHSIANVRKSNIELNESELDLISAAGDLCVMEKIDIGEN